MEGEPPRAKKGQDVYQGMLGVPAAIIRDLIELHRQDTKNPQGHIFKEGTPKDRVHERSIPYRIRIIQKFSWCWETLSRDQLTWFHSSMHRAQHRVKWLAHKGVET